jgi:CHAT domain-containing protein/tetratricopeptide (TPR) repeat protein
MLTHGLLLCLALTPGAADPDVVRLHEDFSTNTLKRYDVEGDVRWQKGRLTLVGRQVVLRRAVQAGYTADVKVEMSLPEGEADHELHVRLQGQDQDKFALVTLVRARGKVTLVNQMSPREEVALPAAAARPQAWTLRARLHYGVIQAKAWPAGAPEPAQWQTTRYSGKTLWAPRWVLFGYRPSGGLAITGWGIDASRPPPVLRAEDQKLLNRARMLNAEAGDLFHRDRPAEALAKVKDVLALHQKVLGRDHLETAASLVNLGGVLKFMGHVSAAQRPLEDAVPVLRMVLGPEHPDTAACLQMLAEVLRFTGQYAAARPRYEQALAAFRRVLGPTHRHTAVTLNGLGLLLEDLGEYAVAKPYLEQALAIHMKNGGAKILDTATTLDSLGRLHFMLTDYTTARRYHERALAISRALDPDGPAMAVSLNNLGVVLKNLEEYREARSHLEQALAIRRKRLPAGSPDTAVTVSNLGELLQTMGDYRSALPLMEEAWAAHREGLGPEHPDTITSLYNVAGMRAAMGQTKAARIAYEEVLAARRRVLGPDHPDTGMGLTTLGTLFQATGQTRLAWQRFAEGTATYARANRRYLAVAPEGDFGSWLLASRYNFYGFASLAEEDGAGVRAHGLDLASAVLDWKAARAQRRLAFQEALVLSRDPGVRDRYGKLVRLRQELARMALRGPGPEPVARFTRRRESLEHQRDELEHDLSAAVGAFGVLQRRARAGPREVAARLPEGAVLVEWVRYAQYHFRLKPDVETTVRLDLGGLAVRQPRWGPARYAAVVIARPAAGRLDPPVRFVPLGEAGDADAAVRAWRAGLRGEPDAAVERRLRERIWEPLARELPAGTRQLLIAPDGELALLPFEAIRLADGQFLVERFQVSYVDTGRDLLPFPTVGGEPGGALVLADPDYDALPDAGQARVGSRPGPDFGRPDRRLTRLPGFVREAKALERAWRAARPREELKVLRGADATEENAAQAHRPRLLYFITHGFFQEDLPTLADLRSRASGFDIVAVEPKPRPPAPSGVDPRLRSGLALAGANRRRERAARGLSDGLLTALEAEDLDLWGTELVVLSACDTGTGEVQVGEGVIGLRRAFQSAGARTVLASLWRVPDEETTRLMTGFIGRWLKGAPKNRALRAAQRDLIRELRHSADPKKRDAPPLYWAAFICHGQPD